MIHVILCGGTGSRLWPLSRELQPKQFIRLINQESLLQSTVLGNRKVCSEFMIVCNVDHSFLAQKQLAECSLVPSLSIFEPIPKNTAAAICFAMLSIAPEEIVLITPADHHIDYSEEYTKAVKEAESYAENDFLTIFGIPPNSPETGYGYIEVEGNQVKKFHEKPNLEVANQYLADGNFYWNSGMICVKPRVFLQVMQKYASHILIPARKAYEKAQKVTCEQPVCNISLEEMAFIPSESIDYALLEKMPNLKVVTGAFKWSDVGSFDSLFSHLPKDQEGNAIGKGGFSVVGSKNNLIIGNKRMISTIDVEDLIIVDTPDALLISKVGSTQKVKEIVHHLKMSGQTLHKTHAEEIRPWGSFTVLEAEEKFKVKRIVVTPGKRLSLQKHHHRSEHWVVVAGSARVTVGQEQKLLHPNQSVYIPLGEIHRIENPGTIDLILIEVQYGEYTGEDDIVRIEDDFQRVPAKEASLAKI